MPYIQYIEENLDDIRNVCRRYPPLKNYDSASLQKLCCKSKSFKEAVEMINGIEDKCVDRSFIFNIFNGKPDGRNLVKGFWVTLLWGNLSIKNLAMAVADEVDSQSDSVRSLAARLERVRSDIEIGNLKKAFSGLSRKGENKIISFFTKLLFFMRNSYPQKQGDPLPLIYDKWTRGIDAVLIAEGIDRSTRATASRNTTSSSGSPLPPATTSSKNTPAPNASPPKNSIPTPKRTTNGSSTPTSTASAQYAASIWAWPIRSRSWRRKIRRR